LWRLGVFAPGLVASIALCLTPGHPGLVFLLLDRMAFGCPLFNLELGLGNGLQALLAPGDLRGHVHAIGQRLAVAALG
jgi:hypothetical protein